MTRPSAEARATTLTAGRQGRRPRTSRPSWDTPLYLAPAMTALGAFVLLPLAIVAVLSLFRYDALSGASSFVGLANYRQILASPQYRNAALNTGEYVLLTVPPTLVLGLLIALGIHSVARGGAFWRAVYFLPVAANLAAMSAVWRWMFYPQDGIIDQTLGRLLGLQGWLQSDNLAIPAVSIVGIWQGVAFSAIIFLAGLASVPPALLDAARLDGARAWGQFWHVTWPALGPAFVFSMVIAFRDALNVYAQVNVMTQGGPGDHSTTLAYLIWQEGIQFLDIGGGAVVTVTLMIIVLAATALQLALGGARLERAGTR
jgi:multiple sugar transport system permease protein